MDSLSPNYLRFFLYSFSFHNNFYLESHSKPRAVCFWHYEKNNRDKRATQVKRFSDYYNWEYSCVSVVAWQFSYTLSDQWMFIIKLAWLQARIFTRKAVCMRMLDCAFSVCLNIHILDFLRLIAINDTFLLVTGVWSNSCFLGLLKVNAGVGLWRKCASILLSLILWGLIFLLLLFQTQAWSVHAGSMYPLSFSN